MARLVVDASVAVKWLVPEDGSAAAEALRGQDLHAPTLMRIEVGNVLRTLSARGAMDEGKAREALVLLLDAPVTWHEPEPALLRDALDMTLALRHPVYDCLYLALAIGIEAPLLTADRRFHRAASDDAALRDPERRGPDLRGIVRLLGED